MKQFDKNIILTFKENNSASIKDVLNQYRDLLDNDKAFVKDFIGMFNVEFKIETESGVRRLNTKDVKNTATLQESLSFGPGGNFTTDEIKDGDEIYNSEPIFIAIALEYDELKDEIIETAKSIVSAMRRYNNTDDVWIDDMRLFGADALYLIAVKYPEYTYLLGLYFIPYWDTEHATGYEDFLFTLVEKRGWTRDMIKAYIWCDNGHFRHFMFNKEVCFYNENDEIIGNRSLGEYLKESPEEYTWFKEELLRRFKEEPVLMYSSDSEAEERTPVVEYFISFYSPINEYNDDEVDQYSEHLQKKFITDTVENEAFDLEEYIKESVDTPLVKYTEKDQDSRDQSDYMDRDKYRGDDLNNLKEFILALPKGENLWSYIESGSNEDILEGITKTELIPIAKKHARNFYFDITYTTSPLDYEGDIKNQLDDILSGVLSDLVYSREEESEPQSSNGLILKIGVRKTGEAEEESTNREEGANQFLRILDVFYRLLGKEEICDNMREIVTDVEGGWNLISIDDFYKRYSKKSRPAEKKLTLDNYSFNHGDKIDYDSRKYVEAVIRQNGRAAYDCSKWGKPVLGRITLATYLLYRDKLEGNFDEITQKLIDYIGKGPWELAVKQLQKHLRENISDDELKLIVDYFTVEPQNPMDLLMGKVSAADTPKLASHETILELLEKHLYRDEECRGDLYVNKFSEHQKSYSLFFYKDGFQNIILCCYWMRNLVPPLSLMADRVFKLLTALAPQWVIRQIGRFYSNDYSNVEFEDEESEERFYKELERAKVPRKQLCAFKMAQVQDKGNITEPCDVDKYLWWLDVYEEKDDEDCGMIGAFRKNEAIALEEGLIYINEQAKLKFYIDLALRNPKYPLDQTGDFERALDIYIKYNTMEESTLSGEVITEKTLAYLSGDLEYREISKIFDENIRKHTYYEFRRTTNYNLGMFVWQLPKEEQARLFTLLLNHSVRGFRILENDLFYSYLRSLVKNSDITMEEYLDAHPSQGGNEVEYWINESYEYLYEHIKDLDIKKENLIAYYLGNDQPLFKELCIEMGRDGIIEKNIKYLSDSQRRDLVIMFKDEKDAKYLVLPFKNDKSRKIKAIVKSILNSK
ncbi:MAG: hypothetical protein PQJ59_18855 [Spirochaetales bacterium]|nr:hypothetical protein [Spirochaetales bacterium]